MSSWKESMINRLSNLINRNRSAAKISQVLCSSLQCIKGWMGWGPRRSTGESPDHQTGVLVLVPAGHIQLCLTRSQLPNRTKVMNQLLARFF